MGTLTRMFDALRHRVVARVREVNEVTTRETIAAGRSLSALVDVAREHIATMQTTVAASAQGSLQIAVTELSSYVRQHAATTREALVANQRRLEQANTHCRTIRDAARHVERLSHEARVLAINALIESRTAHGAAPGMAVIADEMQRLAKTIARVNAEIQQVAGDLGSTLPDASAQGARVMEASVAFEQTSARQIAAIDAQAAALQSRVAHVVEDADQALSRVVGESQAALSHLQFQDVCGQQLLEIDRWLHGAHAEIADEGDDVREPVQVRLGDDASDAGVDASAAGDVLLF
jgi:hypothetical protein